MANKSAYQDLRERVSKSSDPLSLFNECKDYINGILLDGMSGLNPFYQSYCAYVFAMGVSFEIMGDAPMCVALDSSTMDDSKSGIGGISFIIDPIETIRLFRSELEVLFCVGHEVKHLLYKHLVKYRNLYKEETTGVILNLCNDVEVNNSLVTELGLRGKGREAVPTSCFDLDSVSRILGEHYNSEYILSLCSKTKYKYSSLSDVLYTLFDAKCKKVLGYDIDNILYRVQVAKSSFKKEIFNVVDGLTSTVFDISKYPDEAKRFCKELSLYLKRCMFSMLVVAGSTGSDSATGEGQQSNSIGELQGVDKGISTIDEMMDSGTIKIILDQLDNLKDVYLNSMSSLEQKSRGTGDGGTTSFELENYKTTVPWQVVLKRFLTSVSQNKVYTKKRMNRRQPLRMELSGVKHEPSLTLIVAFDDSSSVSNAETSYFFSEFVAIANQFNCDVHFYRFTSKVKSYTYLKKKDVKTLIGQKKGTMLRTRYQGGTSFQPVFDAIAFNTKIKVNRSVLVMFTDGCGEDDVDFRTVKNRMWVVTHPKKDDSGKLSVNISCPEAKKNIYPVVPIRL